MSLHPAHQEKRADRNTPPIQTPSLGTARFPFSCLFSFLSPQPVAFAFSPLLLFFSSPFAVLRCNRLLFSENLKLAFRLPESSLDDRPVFPSGSETTASFSSLRRRANSVFGLLQSKHCSGEHRTVYPGRRESGVVINGYVTKSRSWRLSVFERSVRKPNYQVPTRTTASVETSRPFCGWIRAIVSIQL